MYCVCEFQLNKVKRLISFPNNLKTQLTSLIELTYDSYAFIILITFKTSFER